MKTHEKEDDFFKGLIIMVCVIVAVSAGLTWSAARSYYHSDAGKKQLEESITTAKEELEATNQELQVRQNEIVYLEDQRALLLGEITDAVPVTWSVVYSSGHLHPTITLESPDGRVAETTIYFACPVGSTFKAETLRDKNGGVFTRFVPVNIIQSAQL
jgi:hypothetical protein